MTIYLEVKHWYDTWHTGLHWKPLRAGLYLYQSHSINHPCRHNNTAMQLAITYDPDGTRHAA